MSHLFFRVKSPVVASLVGLSVAWLGACGGMAVDETSHSTETGNPPVVDDGVIRVALVDGKVHVIGEEGAVLPGGTVLTVKNQRSGASVTTTSRSDGSFDVAVDGELYDEYQVSVKGAKSVRVTRAISNTCPGRWEELKDVETAAKATADMIGCEKNADCEIVPRCYAGHLALPVSGVEDYRKQVGSCDLALPCFLPPQPSEPEGVAICTAGICERTVECATVEDVFAQEADRVFAEVDDTCQADDDCLIGSVFFDCFSRCDIGPVSKQGQAELDAQTATLNQTLCPPYTELECELAYRGCLLIDLPAFCVNNRCASAAP